MESELLQFYKKLIEVVEDSYGLKTPKPGDTNAQSLEETIDKKHIALKKSLEIWFNPDYQPKLTYTKKKEISKSYKNALSGHIKTTIDALREVIKNGNIFNDEEKAAENSVYQTLLKLLETSKNPKLINSNNFNLNGAVYRDLVLNRMYWGNPEERSHLKMMNNLAGLIIKILDHDLNSENRKNIVAALKTVFSTNKNDYGMCPGNFNNRIDEASNQICETPKEKLRAYFEAFNHVLQNKKIDNSITVRESANTGTEQHLPNALNYLLGVPKKVITAKDPFMFTAFDSMEIGNIKFLKEHLFEFHQWLEKEIKEDIKSSLANFDDHSRHHEDQNYKTNNKIIEKLIETGVVNSFLSAGDVRGELINELLNEDFSYKKSEEIEAIILESIFSEITKMLGISNSSLSKLGEFKLSEEEKNELMPNEENILQAYTLIKKNNPTELIVLLESIKNKSSKKKLITKTLCFLVQKENKEFFRNFLNILNEKERGMTRNILLSSEDKVQTLSDVADYLIRINDHTTLDLFLAHITEKNKLKILKNIAHYSARRKKPDEFNAIMDKIPKKDSVEILVNIAKIFAIADATSFNFIITQTKVPKEDIIKIIEEVINQKPKKDRIKLLKNLTTNAAKTNNATAFSLVMKHVPINKIKKVLECLLDENKKISNKFLLKNCFETFESKDRIEKILEFMLLNDQLSDADIIELSKLITNKSEKKSIDSFYKPPKFSKLLGKSLLSKQKKSALSSEIVFGIAAAIIIIPLISVLGITGITIGATAAVLVTTSASASYFTGIQIPNKSFKNVFKNRKKLKQLNRCAKIIKSLEKGNYEKARKSLSKLKPDIRESFASTLLLVAARSTNLNSFENTCEFLRETPIYQSSLNNSAHELAANNDSVNFEIFINKISDKEDKTNTLKDLIKRFNKDDNQDALDIVLGYSKLPESKSSEHKNLFDDMATALIRKVDIRNLSESDIQKYAKDDLAFCEIGKELRETPEVTFT
jgi:flagellar motor component MotA